MGVKTLSPAEIFQGNSVGGSSRNSSLLSVGNPTYEKIRFYEIDSFPTQQASKMFVGGLFEKLVVRYRKHEFPWWFRSNS